MINANRTTLSIEKKTIKFAVDPRRHSIKIGRYLCFSLTWPTFTCTQTHTIAGVTFGLLAQQTGIYGTGLTGFASKLSQRAQRETDRQIDRLTGPNVKCYIFYNNSNGEPVRQPSRHFGDGTATPPPPTATWMAFYQCLGY